jgi:hypothetical protein
MIALTAFALAFQQVGSRDIYDHLTFLAIPRAPVETRVESSAEGDRLALQAGIALRAAIWPLRYLLSKQSVGGDPALRISSRHTRREALEGATR